MLEKYVYGISIINIITHRRPVQKWYNAGPRIGKSQSYQVIDCAYAK